MSIDKETVFWFPMRVTYGRELSVKTFLDSEGFETFLPMTTRRFQVGKRVVKKRVPALNNLVFVHDTMQRITEVKQTRLAAQPLRYMMRRPLDPEHETAEVITVPDAQMQSFIKVTEGPEEQFTYLTADELKGHDQGHVVIASGPFAGVEGTIKRVHGNKQVVVELEGIGGITINFVPTKFLIRQ